MTHADQVIRTTRRTLDALARGERPVAAALCQADATAQSVLPTDDLSDPGLDDSGGNNAADVRARLIAGSNS